MIDRLSDCANEMYKLFIIFNRPVNGHMTIDDYKARELVRKLVSQSVNQSVSQSVIHSVSQSVSRSISQPVSQSASQSVSHSINQPVSQSVIQSVNQSASQSVSQSVSHSVYTELTREHLDCSMALRELYSYRSPSVYLCVSLSFLFRSIYL